MKKKSFISASVIAGVAMMSASAFAWVVIVGWVTPPVIVAVAPVDVTFAGGYCPLLANGFYDPVCINAFPIVQGSYYYPVLGACWNAAMGGYDPVCFNHYGFWGFVHWDRMNNFYANHWDGWDVREARFGWSGGRVGIWHTNHIDIINRTVIHDNRTVIHNDGTVTHDNNTVTHDHTTIVRKPPCHGPKCSDVADLNDPALNYGEHSITDEVASGPLAPASNDNAAN